MIGGVIFPEVCAVCVRAAPRPGRHVCGSCERVLRQTPAPHCPGCGGGIDGALEVCSECLETPRPWSHAVSVYEFGGSVRDVIHRFKYRGDVALARPLAAAMARIWLERGPDTDPDLVTAVPLHWLRQWGRGYNQAAMVARRFAQLVDLDYDGVLRRRQRTPPQARLGLRERRRNLRRAFTIRRGVELQGAAVVLVDDVLTTGATLAAAAKVLLAAGVARVDVLTIARG